MRELWRRGIVATVVMGCFRFSKMAEENPCELVRLKKFRELNNKLNEVCPGENCNFLHKMNFFTVTSACLCTSKVKTHDSKELCHFYVSCTRFSLPPPSANNTRAMINILQVNVSALSFVNFRSFPFHRFPPLCSSALSLSLGLAGPG